MHAFQYNTKSVHQIYDKITNLV